ncbi:MAG: pyrroloquinoline quinone biosynthesis peptide chaperone PqqD [Caulobacteraceae bacterium]
MTCEAVVPRLRPGVKFRFDAARAAWVLLAPERVFQPDAVASEVLRRVDGERTLGAIIDDLADAFSAARPTIAADVAAMLRDLAGKGVVSL